MGFDIIIVICPKGNTALVIGSQLTVSWGIPDFCLSRCTCKSCSPSFWQPYLLALLIGIRPATVETQPSNYTPIGAQH